MVWPKIGKHGLVLCVNLSGQRKFGPLYEILNTPLLKSLSLALKPKFFAICQLMHEVKYEETESQLKN